ncbi:hypothetical protein CEQ90_10530 [Lewinellaceae bacterium SD302]|nr:hypothetical protein CEQ90_10530 [Lewinellaceae bacterium SD302]
MTRFLLSLALIACMGFLTAQSTPDSKEGLIPCGVTHRGDWIDAYQRGEIAAVRTTDTLLLPLRIHIVRKSDGTFGIPVETVLETMVLMNQDFATANIKFYIDGEIDFLNNTTWWDHNQAQGSAMMSVNNDPGVINCYFVENPAGACGYYSFGGDALAINNDCTGSGDRTWSHEMGHFLSLPHTFDGFEFHYTEPDGTPIRPLNTYASQNAPFAVGGRFTELADGSNCTIAGDGFCDTPADYLSDRWGCNGSGVYGQPLLDRNGQALDVQAYPIMGYAFDNCVSSFTDEQRTAMVTNATGRPGLIQNIPIDYSAPDPAEMELLTPEDGEIFFAIDEFEVTLDWEDVPDADMYLVQVAYNAQFAGAREFIVYDESEFTLTEANGLIDTVLNAWRVRPINRCNVAGDFGDQEFTFRVLGVVSSTQDNDLDRAVNIFPNPVNGSQKTVRIAANGLSANDDVHIQLVNMTGQVLVNEAGLNVAAGTFRHDLDVANVPAGVYFVRIRQGDRQLTRRLVIGR